MKRSVHTVCFAHLGSNPWSSFSKALRLCSKYLGIYRRFSSRYRVSRSYSFLNKEVVSGVSGKAQWSLKLTNIFHIKTLFVFLSFSVKKGKKDVIIWKEEEKSEKGLKKIFRPAFRWGQPWKLVKIYKKI